MMIFRYNFSYMHDHFIVSYIYSSSLLYIHYRSLSPQRRFPVSEKHLLAISYFFLQLGKICAGLRLYENCMRVDSAICDWPWSVNTDYKIHSYCGKFFFSAAAKKSGLSSSCGVKLIKKGCYHDPGTPDRALPHDLGRRYPKKYDWNEGWDDYLHDLTC